METLVLTYKQLWAIMDSMNDTTTIERDDTFWEAYGKVNDAIGRIDAEVGND